MADLDDLRPFHEGFEEVYKIGITSKSHIIEDEGFIRSRQLDDGDPSFFTELALSWHKLRVEAYYLAGKECLLGLEEGFVKLSNKDNVFFVKCEEIIVFPCCCGQFGILHHQLGRLEDIILIQWVFEDLFWKIPIQSCQD
jgi:hypothetical protein